MKNFSRLIVAVLLSCGLAQSVASSRAAAAASPDATGTPANATAAAKTPAEKWADPALLPSPANPLPPGAPAPITGAELVKLAHVVPVDRGSSKIWYVNFSGNLPHLPLAILGEVAPQLLAYYPAAPGAPATQPSVLVYRAGTTTADNGDKTTLVVDRALIFHFSTNRPLGDALWAVHGPAGSPPQPPIVWRWTADTLTVENPFEKKIQEISLAPKTAPKN